MPFIMVKSRDDLDELKAFLADNEGILNYVLNFIAVNDDAIFPLRVEHP